MLSSEKTNDPIPRELQGGRAGSFNPSNLSGPGCGSIKRKVNREILL